MATYDVTIPLELAKKDNGIAKMCAAVHAYIMVVAIAAYSCCMTRRTLPRRSNKFAIKIVTGTKTRATKRTELKDMRARPSMSHKLRAANEAGRKSHSVKYR